MWIQLETQLKFFLSIGPFLLRGVDLGEGKVSGRIVESQLFGDEKLFLSLTEILLLRQRFGEQQTVGGIGRELLNQLLSIQLRIVSIALSKA